ncbi:MAG: flavin reductase family protein [Candidatus Dormibacteraeota bacterium]|nr:flavin reductase family protein [Candidatus Dormibacteraeota bacterium]
MIKQPAFRDVRARLAAAAVVVATRTTAGLRGMTVTTFTPASLEPPQVLVCLDVLAAVHDAIVSSATFTASVLSREQQFLADRFAGQGPAPDASWSDTPHRIEDGLPVLTGCISWFRCRTVGVHRAGDHDIVIAAVVDWGLGTGEPLVHWERDFWRLAPT